MSRPYTIRLSNTLQFNSTVYPEAAPNCLLDNLSSLFSSLFSKPPILFNMSPLPIFVSFCPLPIYTRPLSTTFHI